MAQNPAIAIPNLLFTYAMRFDDGDFAAAAALFDKGAVIASGRRIAGREAIMAMWARWATCQSQWTVIQAAPGYPLQIVASGRYRDRLACDADGWHFVEREYVQTDLVGDSSAHTLQSLEPTRA